MTHSAAGWCRAGLGGSGRESPAELDSGYGRRGCFMAVAPRLAGGCLWEASSPAFALSAFWAFSLQSVSLPSWSIRNMQRSRRSTRGPKSTHTHRTLHIVIMRAISPWRRGCPHRGPRFSSGGAWRRLNVAQPLPALWSPSSSSPKMC